MPMVEHFVFIYKGQKEQDEGLGTKGRIKNKLGLGAFLSKNV